MDIQSWILESLLDATVNDKVVTVNGIGNFVIVEEKYFILENDRSVEVTQSYFEQFQGTKTERLFDDKFQLILNQDEVDIVSDEVHDIKYFLFNFGERWYYCDDFENPALNEFKYLGAARKELDMEFPFLGIHGGYDLCNGSRLYKDWCKKAKFLGIKTLGIAEDNTLAGTLDFQNSCKDAGIKSIIGETVTVKGKSIYALKLYCLNEVGWKNLLRINAEINVHNNGFVTEEKLADLGEGLSCVVSPESLSSILIKGLEYWSEVFDGVAYQFDLSEWDNQDRDKKWCDLIKDYLENHINDIPPILIYDAYYLDKADAPIRRLLNKIGDVKFKYNSKNQWFKSLDEIFAEQSELFGDEDSRLFEIIEQGTNNLNRLCDKVDFKIEVGVPKLPQYVMTDDEKLLYSNNEELFLGLIQKGLEEKVIAKGLDLDLYIARIEEEFGIIKEGGIISYFLILYDIINWCKTQDIWVGIGRGSAAGSAISWLIGVTQVNPLEYDLIFSRFINSGRLFKKEKEDYVVVNDKISYRITDKVKIKRSGKEIIVQANEISNGDVICEKMR